MHIDRLDVHYVVMPLIYPWRTAYGEDADIHSVLVKLSSGEHTAWAESTPFFAPHYLSESAGSVFYHVTEVFGPHVVGREYDTAADDQRAARPVQGQLVRQGRHRDRLVDPAEPHHRHAAARTAGR